MNHIYKSIFNKALGVFTAVPEFASAHGKGSERAVVGRVAKGTAGFAASALAISVGLALTSTSAVAGPGIYINDGKSDDGCIAIPDASGPNVGIYGISNTGGGVGVAILAPGQVAPNKDYFAMNAMAPCLSSGNVAQAFDTQTNRTLFYGNDSYGNGTITNNGAKNLTLGGRLDVNSGIIGVGDRGVNGLDATNSIRMGMGTALSDDNKKTDAVTIGVNAGASAKHATAIGSATTAKTGYSTALGFQSQAGDPAVTNFNGEYATAIGGKAKALHAYTTALGAETNASGAYATAVGNEAKATHESTTAVGKGAKATNDFATAVGQLALASGKNGTAVGTRNEALGEEATALGYHSHANGSQQLSIGAHAGRNLDGSFSQSTHGISIGSLAGADNATAKSNDDSVLIGTESGRYAQGGDRNTSIGKSAGQYLKGNDNIAMGSNAGSGTATDKLEVSNTVAIGNTAKASGNDGIALGNTANSKTDGAISIGTRSVSGDGDAVPGVTPIGNKSISIGYESVANRYDTIAMGVESSTQAADPAVAPWDAVAIGSKSKATTYKALAIGAYSQATGRQSTVIGNDIQGQNSTASGTRSQILGVQSNVSGDNSVSIGDTNTVASARTYAMGNNINAAAGTDDSLAFGTKAGVGGPNAIALGNTAKASAANTVAISNQAQAKTPYSVALGASAVAGDDSTGALNGGEAAIAIGRQAVANVYNGIAIGKQATIKKDSADGIAIGAETKVNAYKGAAIGAFSEANGSQALAIGNNKQGQSSVASGERSQVIGVESTVSGNNSVAIGDTNNVASERTYAMGNNITTGAGAHDSLAFGTQAYVGNASAIAMGNAAKAVGKEQVSIGKNAGADSANPEGNYYGVYIGSEAGRYQQGDGRNYAIGQNAGQYVKGSSNIALGTNAGKGEAGNVIDASSTIAIGRETKASGYSGISIGTLAETTHANSIALGDKASATNGHDALAVGAFSKTTAAKAMSIGSYSTASGAQSIVIASNYADSAAPEASNRSTATAARAIVMGPESHATAEDALAIGNKNTVASARTYAIGNNINVAAGADDSLVFGTRASVAGINTIAMGNTTQASANYAIAVGNTAQATAEHATAIGNKSVASNVSAIALGRQAQATNENAVALGADSKADGHSSFAGAVGASSAGTRQVSIGHYAGNNTQGSSTPAKPADYAVFIGNYAGSDVAGTNGNTNGVAIGSEAGRYLQSGSNNTAIGSQAGQYVEGSLNASLGQGAGKYVKGNQNIAIGTNAAKATETDKTIASNTIAMGTESAVSKDHAIAIGTMAKSRNFSAVALGPNSDAAGASAVSVGNESSAIGQSSVATGFRAKADGYEQVSIGSSAGARATTISNYAVSIGAHAGADNASTTGNTFGIAIGANAGRNIKSGVRDIAIGQNAGQYVDGDNNTAVGVNAGRSVKGVGNVAYGDNAGSNLVGDNNIAIGRSTNSVADGSTLTVSNTVALGLAAKAENHSNVAIGNSAAATAANAMALGANTKAGTANSVALGRYSETSDVHTGAYTLNNSYTAAGLPNAANGTVSVGSAGKERQIQNVAAGVISATSTDAINGSQLYATNNYMSNFATGVQNVLGGDAAVDNAGNLTMSNIGGTVKGNVHEAIAAVKGVADTAVQEVESANPTALSVKKDGTKVTLTPNFITGDLVNADGTVNAPATADEGKLVSAKTVADALKANHFVVDTKGNTETGSEADAKVGSGNKVTFEAGNNLVAKQANTANGGATVKFSLKDDISLNSVTAGTGANQVVLGNDGVKVGGNTYINNDGLNANSKVISNVADGVNPNDAVNKSQLDAVKGVADSAVKSVDTVASEENLVVDNNDPQNPKLRLKKAVNLTSIKLDGATPGNTTYVSGYGLTIEDGPSVKKEGINAGDKKITNVAAGDVSATSKDAVNGAQLHNVASSVANVLGGNAAVDGNGNVTSSDIGGTGANTVDDAIKAVNATAAKHTTVVEGKNVKVTKGKNAAGGDEYTVATKDDLDVTSVTAGNTTVNTNGLTITGGPSVTRGGIDAGNAVITNVRDGKVEANSKDAVNGGQLHDTNTKLDGVKAKADTAVQDVKSGDENALTAVKDPNTNIVTVTPKLSGDLVDADGNITAPTTPADKGKLVTAGTVADALANTHFVVDTKATDGELDAASQADQKIKAGNKVTLQAGKNLKAKQTNGANGAQVEFSLKDSISLKEVTAGEGANQVVLGNDGVKVGGNTYINNAGLNANGNKITNVADGADPTDAVNKGQLDAVKGVADSAVKSVDVANGEQNLVVDNSDPKNPKLSLKKDLTVDSVKAGDSTLNTDGLTIAGGPSVKKDGIDAGDKKIANVAAGDVSATSKDAVNGGQLYNVANNVKDLIGPDAAIDPATGKVTVADPAKGIGETGKDNIGDAIKHVNDAAKAAADTAKKHTTVEQGDNIVVEESTNADGGKHYKVSTAKNLNVDSVKAGDTTVNNDGVTIAGGPSVTKGGINAGGNTITNVADGVNSNDAVNKGQLDAVKGVADSAVKSVDVANGEQNLVVDNTDPKNPKLSLKKDLTVDSVKAGDSTLNNDGLTIAGGPSVKKDGIDAGDKKITNVATGDVAENSKDAVNGGQLYDVAKNVADLVGPDAKIDSATGKVTVADPAKGIGETGKGNIGDAIKHVNDAAKAAADTAKKHTTVEQGDNIVVEESTNADGGKHYKVSTAKNLNVDSVKAGDTTVNNDGVTIAGGPSVTKGGINAGGNTITNVADGVDAADAVNKGQLNKVDTKVSNVAQNVVNVLGGDATVNGNGDITMSNIGETGKGNINDAIKSVNDLAKKAAAEKTSVKAKEGRSNVTVTEGVNAAGGHEYTVDVERSVTNAGSNYVTVTNNHDADTNTTTYTVDVSAKTKVSLAKADSAVQGLTSKDGNLNFTKGANGNVEVSFNDNLNVKNVTTDRVQVANGPSMTKDGINAAGKAISNVANGNVAADSKDAVNGGQLHETAKSVADVIGGGATVKDGKVVAGQNGIGNTGQNTVHGAIAAINQNTANNFNQIRGDLRKMDRDLRGGIAGALATAGLPQAFRPGKSMVAAAASTYRGQSGLAIGVSRISDNGKVILKVTGNTNSRGDFGGTIGAGYQW